MITPFTSRAIAAATVLGAGFSFLACGNTCEDFCHAGAACADDLAREETGGLCRLKDKDKYVEACIDACGQASEKLSGDELGKVNDCLSCVVEEIGGEECNENPYDVAGEECEDKCQDDGADDAMSDFLREFDDDFSDQYSGGLDSLDCQGSSTNNSFIPQGRTACHDLTTKAEECCTDEATKDACMAGFNAIVDKGDEEACRTAIEVIQCPFADSSRAVTPPGNP